MNQLPNKLLKFNTLVKGFTLIEILLTVSLMSVLSLFGAAGYREYNENKTIDTAAEEVRGVLHLASSRAQSQVKPDIAICDDVPNPEPLYGYRVTFCPSPGGCNADQTYELSVVCGQTGESEERVGEPYKLPQPFLFSDTSEQSVLFRVLTSDIEGISYVGIEGYDRTRVVNVSSNGVVHIANSILPTPTPPPTSTPTPPPSTCELPGTPSSLQPSGNQGPGTYTITWNGADKALRHQLRIDDKTNAWTGTCASVNPGDFCNDNVTSTTYPYTFQLGHEYDIWVQGSNDCGVGPATLATLNIPTPTPTTTPTPTPTSPPPTLTFSAAQTSIAYGSSTTLTWGTTAASSCTASNAWTGSKPTSGSESTGSLTTSRTYILTCSGPGGSINRTVTVNVAAAPTATITPTRTPTLTPTRTPTPSAVTTNIVVNPGLESGNSPWVALYSGIFCANGLSRCDYLTTNYGTKFLYLGGYDNATEWVYQQITIPANATRADWTFKYRVVTAETTTTSKYDNASFAIYNSSGTWLATLGSGLSNLNATGSSWVQGPTFNLLPYKGQTIRIRYGASLDGSLPTDFLYDEVVVTVTYVP